MTGPVISTLTSFLPSTIRRAESSPPRIPKLLREGYPYLLATQWFPPYRAERIYTVLQQPGKKFSPADMLALQTDVTSEYDRFFASPLRHRH